MLIVPLGAGEIAPATIATRSPHALLIDRQPLFLAAVAGLLAAPPLNAEVGMLTRSNAALDRLGGSGIDIVLCELRAEPVTGPDLAAMIVDQNPGVRVILLADAEDEALLLAAFQSGATGFFTKDASSEELSEGILAVLAGHWVVGRRLLQGTLAMLSSGRAVDSASLVSSLSLAERAVLTMIGQGLSIPTIATLREISRKTVRNHLASIYRKLGLRNRTEAMLCAVRSGLASPDVPTMTRPSRSKEPVGNSSE